MSSTSAAVFPKVIWGNIMSFLPPEEQILNSRVSRTWYNVFKTNLGQFALMRAISSSRRCAYFFVTKKTKLIDHLITLTYNEVFNPNSKFTGELLSTIIECKFEEVPSKAIEYLHDLTEKQRAMIQTLQFSKSYFSDFTDEQVVELITLCPNLKSLTLTEFSITGECFAHIPDECYLEKLNLSMCERLNEGFLIEFFQKADCLKEVDLSYTNTTGECLARMLEIVQLEKLNLSGCKNLSEVLLAKVFSKEACLKKLDLSSTTITGECLTHIPEENNLESLSLMWCKNLHEIFLTRFLSKAANLKEFDLSRVKITGECLTHIPEENNLERLVLQLCYELKEGLFKEFFRLKGARLKELNLSNTKITGECLAHVPEKNCLKKLYLSSCEDLNERYFIRFFQRVAYLKEIDLSYTKIMGKCLSCIPEKNCLESLRLMWCQDLNEEFLVRFFQKAAHLKKVDLSGTNTRGEGLVHIPEENQLTKLFLARCKDLDEAFLANFFRWKITRLKELVLSSTAIEGECLTHIPDGCRLEKLYLEGCENLRENALIVFFPKVAYLREVDLGRTGITGESFFYIPKENRLDKLYIESCINLNKAILQAIPKKLSSRLKRF
ncbi:MAG: hypothetical protein PVI40_05305 [Chlamydiota bacterium]|jgi:uncharacterized protein YjbI with pentapeptide repeats